MKYRNKFLLKLQKITNFKSTVFKLYVPYRLVGFYNLTKIKIFLSEQRKN